MAFPDPTRAEDADAEDGGADAASSNADETDTPRRKTRKPKQTQRESVTCQACHKTMPSLTREHLQTHGLTFQRYERIYSTSPAPTPPISPSAPRTGPRDPTSVRGIAEQLVATPSFVTTLADEVAEAIFSGPLRDRLRLALTSVLGSRLAMHGESVALLAKVRRELATPWRIEQGGENGGPTDTRDLVAMAMQAHGEVAKGEDALLRTIKLAIDENKGREGTSRDRGGFQPYTGEAEVVPVPVDLSAEEREAVRSLLATLTQGVRGALPAPSDPISPPTDPTPMASAPPSSPSSTMPSADATPSSPSSPLPEFDPLDV